MRYHKKEFALRKICSKLWLSGNMLSLFVALTFHRDGHPTAADIDAITLMMMLRSFS